RYLVPGRGCWAAGGRSGHVLRGSSVTDLLRKRKSLPCGSGTATVARDRNAPCLAAERDWSVARSAAGAPGAAGVAAEAAMKTSTRPAAPALALHAVRPWTDTNPLEPLQGLPASRAVL